jgi:hypothetical protein
MPTLTDLLALAVAVLLIVLTAPLLGSGCNADRVGDRR